MAWYFPGERDVGRDDEDVPTLVVEGLDVFYGRAHALQSVSLELVHGVLAVVGRNGMGKSTLCNAITGLVPASGSIRFLGDEILGLGPAARGAAGRSSASTRPSRVWRSAG